MPPKTYGAVTAILFAAIATVQTARVIFGWHADIEGFVIPLWWSGLSAVVTAVLAYFGFRQATC
jgi:hypothetical protein